jgi:hypothetical protein
VIAALALCAMLAAGVPAVSPPAAMTNEDVVRMVAAGAPEREILDAIASRPEAFDVSDDMMDELAVAGVSAGIRTAMRRRHDESAPPPAPVSPRAARGTAKLTVTINAAGGPKSLKAPAWANEDIKARLQLPKENDQREIKDLAVFLACTRAEHVPDLWRSKSPLGRDMVTVGRHEILAFVAGGTSPEKKPQISLPRELDADVDVIETHDIVLGVAALIGDRWLQLGSAKLAGVAVGPGPKSLAGKITGAGDLSFKVELSAKPGTPP